MHDRRYGDMSIDDLCAKKRRRKANKDEWIRWNTIISNVAHQSFFYLDRTERLMRVLWEIIPTALFCWLIKIVVPTMHWILAISVAIVIVHILNWILNNNFWNCINSAFPWLANQGTTRTLSYINGMKHRLEKHSSITGLMFLGSLCRFEWHIRSDIDARILRAPGFWNGICAALLTSRERFLATIHRQPLDVYLADSPEFLTHHRIDETPLFTLRRDSRLSDADFPGGCVSELVVSTFNSSK